SEEHTSELQSLTNLVCRLLLEKKMTKAAVLYAVGRWDEGRVTYLRLITEVPRGAEALKADAVKRINMIYSTELVLPLLRKQQDLIIEKRHLPLYWEVHHNIGANYLLLCELDTAETYFQDALGEFYKIGTFFFKYSLNHLGLILFPHGRLYE